MGHLVLQTSLDIDAVKAYKQLKDGTIDWQDYFRLATAAQKDLEEKGVSSASDANVSKTFKSLSELAETEGRITVKRSLEKEALSYAKKLRNSNDPTSRAEAGVFLTGFKMTPELEWLEMGLETRIVYNYEKGTVLGMPFDEGTVVRGNGIRNKKVVNEGKGNDWYAKDMSGTGNHGKCIGKFAEKNGKPIIYKTWEESGFFIPELDPSIYWLTS